MKIVNILVLIACSLTYCKTASQGANKTIEDDSSQFAAQNEWSKVSSEDGNYELFYMVVDNVKNTSPKKDFYILDKTGEKIYENSTYGGYVKWYDNSKIEYFSTPGVMPANREKEDFIMIYDIETGKSFKKSSLSK